MERISLNVFSTLSDLAMFQIKKLVDQTCVDNDRQSYMFKTLFPPSCTPREIDLHMYKSDGKYYMRVDPHFRYDGTNSNLNLLADCGDVYWHNWQAFESALRSLTAEEPPPSLEDSSTPSVPDATEITNWDEITVSDTTDIKIPNYEDIRSKLSQVIIGQDECIETIAYTVTQHLLKKKPTKPVSILAAGPPGVGKSETAKSLAKILTEATGREYSTVWVDLNNFTEKHSVYRLIGAPAGYVGYEDECVFEAVAKNPYTIMVCDEIDKCHPEIMKAFMSIADEGRCSSSKPLSDGSREFDFKQCILFFTSNYTLSPDKSEKPKIGFAAPKQIDTVEMENDEVRISYRENHSEANEEPLPLRIFRQTEQARKAFVEVGVLREIASRFQCFVNFKPLSSKAKTRILAKQIIVAGFEYSHAISYIAPSIMQEIINAAMSGDSLTVRSFRAIIEGYLAPVFASTEILENQTYRLEGTLDAPQMIPQ